MCAGIDPGINGHAGSCRAGMLGPKCVLWPKCAPNVCCAMLYYNLGAIRTEEFKFWIFRVLRAPRCLSEIGQQGNCPNSKRKPPPLGGFRESERKFEISVAVGISGLPQFELCDSSATGRRQLSDTSAESKIQNPENPQCESAPGGNFRGGSELPACNSNRLVV